MTITGNILITGGSGTLGHAIVRTALAERWDCSITIYSRSELRQAEMRQHYGSLRYILGDVRDYDRLAAAVAGHDLIIHAAAMKRLPECEAQPSECYQTNVIGAANVARAAIAGGVSRVIGISTDKACRAITAYGASKLAMEKLFLAQPDGRTAFALVRYGNVVASNGSVIPLWRQQAEHGEALSITDPGMTRFWMSERDAVKVIEQAYVIIDRAIVVPKMGALSIADMAQIVAPGAAHHVTGLRSVEKRHEDLVATDELALDKGAGYVLTEQGTRGHRYTSEIAPRLSRAQFLAMLQEAEDG